MEKRIFKIAMILIAYSIVYYLWDARKDLSEIRFSDFFRSTYATVEHGVHLWYLYCYIGFLICLPLLQLLCRNLKKKHFWYIVLLSFVFTGLLPLLEFLLWKGKLSHYYAISPDWLVGMVPLYPIVGYYLHNRVDINCITGKQIALLWLVNIAVLVGCCVADYYRDFVVLGNTESTYLFIQGFRIVNCITWFLSFRYVFEHAAIPKKGDALIHSLGKNTFIIYLLHWLFLGIKYIRAIPRLLRRMKIPPMLSIFAEVAFVLFVAYFSALLYRFVLQSVKKRMVRNQRHE